MAETWHLSGLAEMLGGTRVLVIWAISDDGLLAFAVGTVEKGRWKRVGEGGRRGTRVLTLKVGRCDDFEHETPPQKP